jgi:hypothetical protein
LLYDEVLRLPIFSDVGAEGTAKIISNILDKLFWLAVLALLLGVLGYLTSGMLSRRKPLRSNLTLSDASIDRGLDLNNELLRTKGPSTRRKERKSESRNR